MRLLRIVGKTIVIVICLTIILTVGGMFLAKFKGDVFPGAWVKRLAIHYPVLVSIVNFNEPGDSAYLYLDPQETSLIVNLYNTPGAKPSEEVEDWIQDMVLQTTGKKAVIRKSTLKVKDKPMYSDEDLNEIRSSMVDRFNTQSSLNIIYLTLREEQPSNVGLTLHRDTIFIFNDALYDLAERRFKIERLEKSTIKHEWGHLLGVEHSDDPGCLMSSLIEVQDQHFLGGREISVDYCLKTIRELERQRERLQ